MSNFWGAYQYDVLTETDSLITRLIIFVPYRKTAYPIWYSMKYEKSSSNAFSDMYK